MAVDAEVPSNLVEQRRKGSRRESEMRKGGRVLSVLDCSLPQVMVSTVDLQGRIDQGLRRGKPQVAEMHAADDVPTSRAHPAPRIVIGVRAPRNGTNGCWPTSGANVRIDVVGIHDNFFELGGDSVLNIQITAGRIGPAEIHAETGVRHQTIAALRHSWHKSGDRS